MDREVRRLRMTDMADLRARSQRVEIIGLAVMVLGESKTVMPAIGGVQTVVTSPPYNQMANIGKSATGLWGDKSVGLGFVENWEENGYADDLPEEEYQQQQSELFDLIAQSCAANASLFYNHQLRWRDGNCLHPIEWFKPREWRLRSEIIWDRAGGMMFNARMFCRFDERILWMVRGKEWKWNQDSVGYGTVWRIAKEQNKSHPVAFPVALPARCIAATTSPQDIVLDPFSGSASTGVAAVQMGRNFIGVERESKYFDAACERIENAQRQGDMFVENAA